jgi:uncharacterized protein YjiK
MKHLAYKTKIAGLFILALVFLQGCKKNDDNPPNPDLPVMKGELELINEFNLDVSEPSGLSFGKDGTSLFTVSDNTNKVYELSFEGEIIRELEYTGTDLEGITYNSDDDVLTIVEERDRQMVILDYESGEEIERFDIDVKVGTDNKGLEGISWNSNNHAYYILNEDDPALLMIWKKTSGIISEINLNFAGDYSGIFVESNHANLWIVSDESKMLYRCDYSAKVLEQFELDFSKAEGIVVDSDQNRVYIVNDKLSKLFVYKIKK